MSELSLVDFLLARLDDDERTDMGMNHYDRCRQFGGWPGEPETYEPCTCGVSARVLVEVESKRRIVAKYVRVSEAFERSVNPATSAAVAALAEVVDLLASVYADHDQYDEGWKP